MAKLNEKALSEEDLLVEIKDQFKQSKEHSADWRTQSREAFDFVANRQWSEEDKAALADQGRPEITFNRMGPYFDAISGYEINNRQQIKFKPRTVDDSKQTEILNAAVKWVLNQTNAEDEESDAFMDTLISGMGWIGTSMEYEVDPDGKVCMERVDPMQMYWDNHSRKKNLSDSRFLQRVQWKTEKEIKALWPNAKLGTTSDVWEDEPKTEPHNASMAFLYRKNASGYDEKDGRYRVIQHQYYETETFYKVVNPQTGEAVTLDEKKYKIAKAEFAAQNISLLFAKQKKRVYKECFVIADEIVEQSDLKCEGFTFKCITGKRDRNLNLWYGLARVMIDPQKWANKFFSQILHVVNSNAKGGLLAEEGAFVDPKKAEENWSESSSITLLKNGGLTKIKEKSASTYPQGLDKMLQFAVGSIPDVTGVNMEFLGAVDRQQAGVLEQERKKSAFTILAGFFDSLRLYRKDQARLLMHYIKAYLNDGRIIRITTPQGEQPVPLRLTDDAMTYDVVVDQAPDSPNLKEEVWSTLGTLVPQFLKAGIPLPPDILKFSPLPADMAEQFAQGMAGKLPPQAQEAMDKMQQDLQALEKQNFELKQAATDKQNAIASKHELGKEQNQILANQIGSQQQLKTRELDQKQSFDIAGLQLEMKKMAEGQTELMLKMRAEFEQDMANRLKDVHIAELSATVNHHSNMVKAAQSETKATEARAKAVEKTTKTDDSVAKAVAALAKQVKAIEDMVNKPKPTKVKATPIRDKSGKMIGANIEVQA